MHTAGVLLMPQNVGAHHPFNDCASNHDKGHVRSRCHFAQALSELDMARVNSAQNLKPHLDPCVEFPQNSGSRIDIP